MVDEGCGTCADVDLDGYEDLVCGGTDCDDTNDEIYPGVTELCDLVDNNCDGEIDEGCIPSCVLSTEWYDEDYYEITEASSDDLISLYAEGDGICTSVTFGLYSTLYDGSSYVADSLVTEVSGVDDGLNGFYAELDLSTLSLEDGYYIFDAEGVESSTLLICSDLESCTDDFDLPETESCLYEGWDYNFFVDENLGYIAGAADGEEVTLFSLNDGSCTDLQFHLHELIDNGDGTFNTGILVETFSGDFYSEDYEGDTFYYDLSYWTASGLDSYYYFIVSAGDYATYGDSLYVCSVAPCDGLIVTPIDVDDVVATYGLAATGDDTTDDTTTTDTTIDSGDQGTEECPWDCTGVEWEECIDGVEFRDLSLCVGPEDPNCFVDDSSWPDYERSCGEGSVDYYDYSDDSYDEYRDTEDVPVFTWINMLLVVFVLVGYYWKRNL